MLPKMTFEVTVSGVVPIRPSVSTTMRSGFSSKRGMQQSMRPDVGSTGTGSLTWMPGSRIGRGTPVSTVDVSPNPLVGATDVSDGANIRMPSNRSSCVGVPAGSRMAVVRVTGAGSGLPDEVTDTSPGSEASICVRLKNSVAVPTTPTASPTAATGATDVNTKMPSDVCASASIDASGVCMKKPFDLRAVTMPVVLTSWPARGEARPAPWICEIVTGTGVQLRVGEAEFRGCGDVTEKSALLLSVS